MLCRVRGENAGTGNEKSHAHDPWCAEHQAASMLINPRSGNSTANVVLTGVATKGGVGRGDGGGDGGGGERLGGEGGAGGGR